MYTNFKEFFKLNEEEIELLWNDSLIILDTNVILNIYRYSESTNAVFLDVLKKYHERLWIPFHVGKEFTRKRLLVIEQQIKAYTDANKETNHLEELFSNKKRNPFLSDELLSKLIGLFNDVNKELDIRKDQYEERLINDDLLNFISELFIGKVGNQYSETELDVIHAEAEQRYLKKLPPGFEDQEKGDNKYGDFIIWKQILDKAVKDKKRVLFITDDAKKDWWEIVSGKTLGPRPELKKEFFSTTGELFHMYNPFSFMKYATEKLKVTITSTNLAEIKELRPIRATEVSTKPSIIITAIIKRISTNSKFENLIENLRETGYDMKTEEVDSEISKIYFSVPNIPDLPRRIKKRVFEHIEDYGFSLIEYTPLQ